MASSHAEYKEALKPETEIETKVKQYKARVLRDEAQPTEAERAAMEMNPAHESLRSKCVKTIARNFRNKPSLDGIAPEFLPYIAAQLPTDLPIELTAPLIHDENYWSRCATEERGWKNCSVAEHGQTWKQLFFEKNLQQVLEDFDPATDDIDELRRRIHASEDYVFSLKITELLSHIDMEAVFKLLQNLTALELTYGVRHIGMKYERALFGLKIADARSLAKAVKQTETLTVLSLPQNLMDDDLLRMLMTGLINNNTITHLDVSHNKITNHGARLLSKLLSSRSVITCLNLCDNQVHAEGGKYLGKALRTNDSLVELNLRLNRIGDGGGRYLFDDLRSNNTLELLNVSSNSLGHETARSLSQLLKMEDSHIAAIDISCNDFSDDHARTLRESVQDNTALTSLDLRMNQIKADSEHALALQRKVQANELAARSGDGGW